MKLAGKSSYRAALTEKQYLKMIAANLVSRFGDSVDAVAFGWLVYELTGSKELLAVIMGVNLLPTVLLQPFTGALVNYFDKKRLLVFCDFGRGLLVAGIAVLYLTGGLSVPLLFLITILNSTLEAVRMPCGMSLLPKILKKENFAAATALNQSVSRASELIGMGLSGLLIAVLGVGGAVLIDAVSFLGSAAILSFLRVPEESGTERKHYFKELREGFGYFRSNRAIVIVTVLCCLLNLIESPLSSLRPAYISEGLRMGTDALSAGSLTLSLGMLLGAFLYPWFAARLAPVKVFVLSGSVIGLIYLALSAAGLVAGQAAVLVFYGGMMLLYGFTSASVDMALNVVMISNIEGDYMARVGGIFNALACLSSPAAAFAIAAAVRFLPVMRLYAVMGILTVVLFVGISFRKDVRALR